MDELLLLTRRDIERMCKLSRSAIYRYMDDARSGFPKPLKLNGHAVRWKLSEVKAWVESRPRTIGEDKRT